MRIVGVFAFQVQIHQLADKDTVGDGVLNIPHMLCEGTRLVRVSSQETGECMGPLYDRHISRQHVHVYWYFSQYAHAFTNDRRTRCAKKLQAVFGGAARAYVGLAKNMGGHNHINLQVSWSPCTDARMAL